MLGNGPDIQSNLEDLKTRDVLLIKYDVSVKNTFMIMLNYNTSKTVTGYFSFS